MDGEIPVWFDSGNPGGADVFEALAPDASAVILGQPYVYGIVLADEEGVSKVLLNYLAELESVLGLWGCSSIEDASRE